MRLLASALLLAAAVAVAAAPSGTARTLQATGVQCKNPTTGNVMTCNPGWLCIRGFCSCPGGRLCRISKKCCPAGRICRPYALPGAPIKEYCSRVVTIPWQFNVNNGQTVQLQVTDTLVLKWGANDFHGVWKLKQNTCPVLFSGAVGQQLIAPTNGPRSHMTPMCGFPGLPYGQVRCRC
ncbi:hypothetical protein ABPG75_008702 [Micractinium tetrahymenae]